MIKNLCKDNANERNESLLSNCRVQLIFCKDMIKYLTLLFLPPSFSCYFGIFISTYFLSPHFF